MMRQTTDVPPNVESEIRFLEKGTFDDFDNARVTNRASWPGLPFLFARRGRDQLGHLSNLRS